MIEGYKDTPAHEQWLCTRIAAVHDVSRRLVVWKADAGPVDFDSAGPLCIVYVEDSRGLDGGEFSRYWLLSRGWPLGHPPSVECLLNLVAVARRLGIVMIGRIRPMNWLAMLEQGQAFAPQVENLAGKLWYPEDVVFGAVPSEQEQRNI